MKLLIFFLSLIHCISAQTTRGNEQRLEVLDPLTLRRVYIPTNPSSDQSWLPASVFGTVTGNLTGELAVLNPLNGCDSALNTVDATGKWCLVDRSTFVGCNNYNKTMTCQKAGGIGIIQFNSNPGSAPITQPLPVPTPYPDIPALMVGQSMGAAWRSSANPVVISIHYDVCKPLATVAGVSGTFTTHKGHYVVPPNLNCTWDIVPPVNAKSLVFFYSEWNVVPQVVLPTLRLYETSTGVPPRFVSATTGARPSQSPLSVCAPNGIQVQYDWPGYQRVNNENSVYNVGDSGFVGNYYTCPGPSRLDAMSGIITPGCAAVTGCTWILETKAAYSGVTYDFPRPKTISLFFRNISLAEGATITVYSGDVTSGTATVIGTITSETSFLPMYTVEDSFFLSVEYHTPVGSESNFYASFHNGACNNLEILEVTQPRGFFSDGSFSGRSYPGQLDCSWRVKATSNPYVPIYISRIRGSEINPITAMLPDYIKFLNHDGKLIHDTRTTSLQNFWMTNGPSFDVDFYSDTFASENGFAVEFEAAPCHEALVYSEFSGVIAGGSAVSLGLVSEGSAVEILTRKLLPAGTPCYWAVVSRELCTIAIYFIEIKVESADEQILVNDGNVEVAADFVGPSFTESSKSLLVPGGSAEIFATFEETTLSYFTAIFHAGSCTTTPPIIRDQSGSIDDGSFQNLYFPGLKCSWIISPKYESDVARVIKLSFSSFFLRQTDYVRIFDGNNLLHEFSGVTASNVTLYMSEIRIEFETDSDPVGVQYGWTLDFTSASACPAEFFVGADERCAVCPSGQGSAGGFVRFCDPCPAGTKGVPLQGCVDCPTGTFQSEPGMSTCLPCGAGYNANATRTTTCAPCPRGTIASDAGSISCRGCEQGTFQDREGQTECLRCAIGEYADEMGSVMCTKCPASTTTLDTASYSVLHCQCIPGYFGQNGTECHGCPSGAACAGGSGSPEAMPGYWQSNLNNQVFVPCIPAAACLGGSGSPCAEGYTGDRCGGCQGPEYYRLDEGCRRCPAAPGWWVVLSVFVPIIFCFWLLQSVSRNFKSGSVAIGFDFLQVLSLTAAFDLGWPDSLQSVYSTFSFLNFNIEVLAPECTFRAGYWEKWWILLAIPFIMGIVFLIMFAILKIVKKVFPRAHGRRSDFLFNYDYFVNGFIMFMSLIHPLLLSKSLEVFECIDDGAGQSYMRAHPIQLCHVASWDQKVPVAVLGIILYGFGIPIAFFFILWKFRYRLHEPRFVARFGSIYYCYASECYFWEVIVKLRKFFLVVIRFGFSSSGTPADNGGLWTAAIGMAILFAYLMLVIYYKPFSFVRNNALQVFVSIINIGAVFAGVLFFSEKFTEESSSILNTIVFVVFLFALVVLALHIAREFSFGFRASKAMRLIPSFFFKYNIVSFENSELANTDDGFQTQYLFDNIRYWIHTHQKQQRQELVSVLHPLGITAVNEGRGTLYRIFNPMFEASLRLFGAKRIHVEPIPHSASEYEMDDQQSNLSLEVTSPAKKV